MKYSFVIPVYNEVDSLAELYGELRVAVGELGAPCEVIFVDDGSTDGSFEVLAGIAAGDPVVGVIRLMRNAGKSAAYTAGFEAATGDLIVTMDADLQDDPGELRKLKARLEKGYDLVVGWKQGRHVNEPGKSAPSAVYNAIKGGLFGLQLHDSNCGFRIMRREVGLSLCLYGDRYRFIPELAHLMGFRVSEARVKHRRRKHGRSKYGPARFWTGLLDLVSVRFLTVYGPKPLHFFGTIGLVPLLIGMALEIYVLLQKLGGSTFQQHVAAIIIGVMLIVIGFQFWGIGLVCEMISAASRRPIHHIRERVGFRHPDA